MTLFDYPECPYALTVRIVLAETELDFETVKVDIRAGDNHKADFLELNPFGKVPVLIDDETVVYDSTVINEYLNDEYFAELLPEDSAQRATARVLEDYADVAFTLPAMAVARAIGRPMDDRDSQRLDGAKEVLRKGLSMLDRVLVDKEYLVGAFSLADVAFAPTLLRLDKLDIKVDSSFPNVKAWLGRLAERPSMRVALPA
ncbi:MAG: glutathione S-transferase family protein [Myxococcales bacterium]|nr:MAG: glutathione S-transferase family protein [Myxococcales bacterium]